MKNQNSCHGWGEGGIHRYKRKLFCVASRDVHLHLLPAKQSCVPPPVTLHPKEKNADYKNLIR